MWGQALLSPAPCMPPQPTTWIESSRRERKCLTLPGGTVQTSHYVGRGWFIWFYRPCMAWNSWKIAYVRFLLREIWHILRFFSDPGLVPNAAPIDLPDHRSLAMAPNWGDGGWMLPRFLRALLMTLGHWEDVFQDLSGCIYNCRWTSDRKTPKIEVVLMNPLHSDLFHS